MPSHPPPLQPVKAEPWAAEAVKVTVLSAVKDALQSVALPLAHAIAAGLLVTCPPPVPTSLTASTWLAIAKRPILSPAPSTNHRALSGPNAMAAGALWKVAMVNSVTIPEGVIRPMLLPRVSVNQRLPSGPAAMPAGVPLAAGIVNSAIAPAGVMRPILSALNSVNQRLPSGPAAMPSG